MSRPFYIKQTKAGRVFDVCNVILLILFMIIVVYPFINVFAISLNAEFIYGRENSPSITTNMF